MISILAILENNFFKKTGHIKKEAIREMSPYYIKYQMSPADTNQFVKF